LLKGRAMTKAPLTCVLLLAFSACANDELGARTDGPVPDLGPVACDGGLYLFPRVTVKNAATGAAICDAAIVATAAGKTVPFTVGCTSFPQGVDQASFFGGAYTLDVSRTGF
jgi:hypothetical protein